MERMLPIPRENMRNPNMVVEIVGSSSVTDARDYQIHITTHNHDGRLTCDWPDETRPQAGIATCKTSIRDAIYHYSGKRV